MKKILEKLIIIKKKSGNFLKKLIYIEIFENFKKKI